MTELIDKDTVTRSHRARLRDFYKNPKDCPINPRALDQSRDFFRTEGAGKIIPKERTKGGKPPDELVRAALQPENPEKEFKDFGPVFLQQYKGYPPRRRAEIINSLKDFNQLLALLSRETAPTHKGLINKRLKELGYESDRHSEEGPT